MLQKLENNTEKYSPVDDKIKNFFIDIYHGGVDLLHQGVETSFTDFCFGQSCIQSSQKKRAEKGTLKLVNIPLTQADDYVVIFITCVNV